MDCQEMRTVVGVDNALDTPDDGDDTNEGPFCAMFDGLSAENQAIVNKVGEAILGLGDDAASPTRGRDAAWWDKLTNAERVNALYGAGALDTIDPDSDQTADVDESKDDATERAQADYADLDAGTKALVTDRWQWIYNTGVRGNDDGLAGVIYWWDSIECAERLIATRYRQRSAETSKTVQASAPCWDGLNPAPGNDDGQMHASTSPRTRSSHSRHRPGRSGRRCMVEHAEQRPDGLRRLRQPADEDRVLG